MKRKTKKKKQKKQGREREKWKKVTHECNHDHNYTDKNKHKNRPVTGNNNLFESLKDRGGGVPKGEEKRRWMGRMGETLL